MEQEPLEIERKFLIRRPAEKLLLEKSERRIGITQIYLTRGEAGETRRLRRSRVNGEEIFYYTEKLRLTDRTRIERERTLSREEFESLLPEADPERQPIEKTRWCVPWEGHTLEIDVFPFWQNWAFCEVELSAENEALSLPPWLEVLREVTADPRFTNSALAREIPVDTEEKA